MELRAGAFPVAESYYESHVSLPLFPAMTDEDIEHVVESVKEVCRPR